MRVKPAKTTSAESFLNISFRVSDLKVLIVGGGNEAFKAAQTLLLDHKVKDITIVASQLSSRFKYLDKYSAIKINERSFKSTDFDDCTLAIAATENIILDEEVRNNATLKNVPVHISASPELSDFVFTAPQFSVESVRKNFIKRLNDGEVRWRRLASQLIAVFTLMVVGHIIISYLPLPSIGEVWADLKPHLTGTFFLFILAGFLAQMVDGVLSMGYGVTSATVLISTGISPVSVSAAIHTSEIFSTGVSGFSHYKFGNVNKKLFKHIVIPGVIGAILGALALVYLGENGGKWLMPMVALYALFLGVKILLKAFTTNIKNNKVKRVGWLAWLGGFLDSFGGGGWGPIVTSTLISKGKSPKYTVGTVSLTEFFVTLSSAFTFFLTVGIGHWNVVLGLIIGGMIAAPFAARLAGKLPKKTMMIAVGIMVIIWCIRIIIKSL